MHQLYTQNKALTLIVTIFNCHIDDVNSHEKGNIVVVNISYMALHGCLD